jgi:hypothetical protein
MNSSPLTFDDIDSKEIQCRLLLCAANIGILGIGSARSLSLAHRYNKAATKHLYFIFGKVAKIFLMLY